MRGMWRRGRDRSGGTRGVAMFSEFSRSHSIPGKLLEETRDGKEITDRAVDHVEEILHI